MSKKSGIRDKAVAREDAFRFDPRELKVRPGFNSRDYDFDPNDEADMELANSIAAVGVREPLTVFMENGEVMVLDGHRRLAATMFVINNLGVDVRSVPGIRERDHANEGDRVLNQIVRNTGKRLQPLEEARVIGKLLDLGWPDTEISEKTGYGIQKVRDRIELLGADPSVHELVSSGQVSATVATQTLKSDPEAATTLTEAATVAKQEGRKRVKTKDLETAGAKIPGNTWQAYFKNVNQAVGNTGIDDEYLDAATDVLHGVLDDPDNVNKWIECAAVCLEAAIRSGATPTGVLRLVKKNTPSVKE